MPSIEKETFRKQFYIRRETIFESWEDLIQSQGVPVEKRKIGQVKKKKKKKKK